MMRHRDRIVLPGAAVGILHAYDAPDFGFPRDRTFQAAQANFFISSLSSDRILFAFIFITRLRLRSAKHGNIPTVP
jgi:hypothetical protein